MAIFECPYCRSAAPAADRVKPGEGIQCPACFKVFVPLPWPNAHADPRAQQDPAEQTERLAQAIEESGRTRRTRQRAHRLRKQRWRRRLVKSACWGLALTAMIWGAIWMFSNVGTRRTVTILDSANKPSPGAHVDYIAASPTPLLHIWIHRQAVADNKGAVKLFEPFWGNICWVAAYDSGWHNLGLFLGGDALPPRIKLGEVTPASAPAPDAPAKAKSRKPSSKPTDKPASKPTSRPTFRASTPSSRPSLMKATDDKPTSGPVPLVRGVSQ